jgi:hypothetical protein
MAVIMLTTWADYQNAVVRPQLRKLARLTERLECETNEPKRRALAAQVSLYAASIHMTQEEIDYLLAYHGYTSV